MISSNNSPLFFWIHIWSFYQKAFARQGFPFFPPGFFTKNRIWITTGILVFLIALSLRSWDNLTHPGLYVEDAGYFNYYYGGDRPLSAVFDRGRGYMNVINHMYAWLVSRVDVRVQPGLYLLFSIMIGIVTAVNLLFSGLFKSKLILLIAPLVLGLTGMNHIFYYNTLVYQFYTTVLLLLCLLFFPAPRTRSGWVGICVVYIILSWSGPYSILAVPTGLLLLLFFKDRRKGFLLFITIISTLLYFTTVKNGTTILNHIVNGQVMGLYFKTLFKEIFFLGLLGNPTIAKVGIFLFCLMVLFYLQRKDKEYLKLSLVFFALIIGALAPFF